MRNIMIGGTGLVIAGLATSAASAAGPALQIDWSINGGVVNEVLPEGVDVGNGVQWFEGSAEDAGTGLVLDFAFTADSTGLLDGNVSLVNELNLTLDVAVDVKMAMGLDLSTGSKVSAIVTVGLTSGPGGGIINSVAPALWRMTADGQPTASPQNWLFFHPFFISNGGIGTSSTTTDFGIPFPIDGPPIDNDLGFSVNFTLSEQDVASVSTSVSAGGCVGNVNGDDAVDTIDMTLILEGWGPCGEKPCPADLNNDGLVDTSDFLLVLAFWGPCR